jgi:hypothetical protein
MRRQLALISRKFSGFLDLPHSDGTVLSLDGIVWPRGRLGPAEAWWMRFACDVKDDLSRDLPTPRP